MRTDIEGLPLSERALVEAIREVADELKGLREDYANSPGMALSAMMLDNARRQMGGGIVPVPGIIKPGNH